MSKPSIQVIMQLDKLDKKIKELQKKKSSVASKLLKKYGQGVFYFELEDKVDDKKFAKLVIIDNCAKLKKGETIWKSTGFSEVEFSLSHLKNKPKEMK